MTLNDLVQALANVPNLRVVEYPDGTHLSRSSTPGGESALVRDEDNALVTHADLFPAGNEVKAIKVAYFAVGAIASAAVCLGAVKAAPHVKSKFNDLKARLSRKSDDATEDTPLNAVPDQLNLTAEEPDGGRHLSIA
ncbi:hypothetical protein [Streptomyces sp. NPDC058745]|uniref:hypothetical protein n=1 Tax=Streptomyces sp. NPDC058745 TaxID=3346621 RepID=UPI0036C71611